MTSMGALKIYVMITISKVFRYGGTLCPDPGQSNLNWECSLLEASDSKRSSTIQKGKIYNLRWTWSSEKKVMSVKHVETGKI